MYKFSYKFMSTKYFKCSITFVCGQTFVRTLPKVTIVTDLVPKTPHCYTTFNCNIQQLDNPIVVSINELQKASLQPLFI